VSCEDTDISRDTMSMPLRMQRQYTIQSNSDMLRQRNQTFEKTYQEMKSRATPEQTHFVFENLSLLQLSIQSNCANLKKNSASQEDSKNELSSVQENLSPTKRSNLSRRLFQDKSERSKADSFQFRPPLMHLDTNSLNEFDKR